LGLFSERVEALQRRCLLHQGAFQRRHQVKAPSGWTRCRGRGGENASCSPNQDQARLRRRGEAGDLSGTERVRIHFPPAVSPRTFGSGRGHTARLRAHHSARSGRCRAGGGDGTNKSARMPLSWGQSKREADQVGSSGGSIAVHVRQSARARSFYCLRVEHAAAPPVESRRTPRHSRPSEIAAAQACSRVPLQMMPPRSPDREVAVAFRKDWGKRPGRGGKAKAATS
jgi:hypothetical protein